MSSKKAKDQKNGRDAKAGKSLPVKDAQKQPDTTVNETSKKK